MSPQVLNGMAYLDTVPPGNGGCATVAALHPALSASSAAVTAELLPLPVLMPPPLLLLLILPSLPLRSLLPPLRLPVLLPPLPLPPPPLLLLPPLPLPHVLVLSSPPPRAGSRYGLAPMRLWPAASCTISMTGGRARTARGWLRCCCCCCCYNCASREREARSEKREARREARSEKREA